MPNNRTHKTSNCKAINFDSGVEEFNHPKELLKNYNNRAKAGYLKSL